MPTSVGRWVVSFCVSGLIQLTSGQHLLRLFPPHTAEPPSEPSAYLYLAQSAQDPHEALGYYSTAAAMIEKTLSAKSKSKAGVVGVDETEDEERKMATTALVAMIEIWMSDLW